MLYSLKTAANVGSKEEKDTSAKISFKKAVEKKKSSVKKSAGDIANEVLAKVGKPLHGDKLHKQVVEAGGKITKASLQVALGRHPDIKKTAPNTWTVVVTEETLNKMLEL